MCKSRTTEPEIQVILKQDESDVRMPYLCREHKASNAT